MFVECPSYIDIDPGDWKLSGEQSSLGLEEICWIIRGKKQHKCICNILEVSLLIDFHFTKENPCCLAVSELMFLIKSGINFPPLDNVNL